MIFSLLSSNLSISPARKSRRLVFLQIKDASKVPSTPESAFYESSECPSITLKIPLSKSISQSKFTFSGLKHYLSNRNLIYSCHKKEAQILSIKSYWREAGFLPSEDVKNEIRKADNFRLYTPNLLETQKIAQFLFFNRPIPSKNQKTLIKHQLLGICMTCRSSKGKRSFHHFIIDRNANSEFPDVWNTKIRIIYLGEGNNCQQNDKGWAEKRASGLNIKDETFGLRGNYSMTNLMKDIKNYFRNYPIYNALYNCQHFATNLYNKITGKSQEFISQDLMVIKEKNGVLNEGKLKYNFQ